MSQSVMDERQLFSPGFGSGMRQSATQVTQGRREDTPLADARSRLVAGGRRRAALAGARLVGTRLMGNVPQSVHGNVCGRGCDAEGKAKTLASNGALV